MTQTFYNLSKSIKFDHGSTGHDLAIGAWDLVIVSFRTKLPELEYLSPAKLKPHER
jgi:hypothetical protein